MSTTQRLERMWDGRKSNRKYWQWLDEDDWSMWHLFAGSGFPKPGNETFCGHILPSNLNGIRSRISTPDARLCYICNKVENGEEP